MNEGRWVSLLATADCPPGSQRFVEAGGHELAVFHLTDPDRFVVIANSCPHAGGNLSAGEVTGDVVTCPWHDWKFSLETSRCTESEAVCVKKYDCRVESGRLFARLPD